jgi:hypothetical protein
VKLLSRDGRRVIRAVYERDRKIVEFGLETNIDADGCHGAGVERSEE